MHSFQKFIVVLLPTTLPRRNKDMEISCESLGKTKHYMDQAILHSIHVPIPKCIENFQNVHLAN